MRFAHKLTIDGTERHLLADRWYLEANAPGRAIIDVAADAPLSGVVTYAIGWDGDIEPWFTGAVQTSVALDGKRQRLRVVEIDHALRARVPLALRNQTVRDMLDAIADATGIAWRVGRSVDLSRRFAHLAAGGTARAALQRLGRLLDIDDWTLQALPTGEVYIGAAAGLRPATIALPSSVLADVTTTGAGIRAVPRLRPGCRVTPGNGDTMTITAVELSIDTYRLHWRRSP